MRLATRALLPALTAALAVAAVAIATGGGDGGTAAKKQTVLFATVGADGRLVDGRGVKRARFIRQGETAAEYAVTFRRNVSRCAATATPGGNRKDTGALVTGRAVTSISGSGDRFGGAPMNRQVFVLTVNEFDVSDSRMGFHLVVAC